MMKINFSLLDEPMEVNLGTVLVIEDVSVFAQLVKEFYQYDEQSNLTIFDSKIRSIRSSELLLITDILGYDINTSQVLKLLHTDIVSQLNDKPEVRSEIDSLVSLITDIIMAECIENETYSLCLVLDGKGTLITGEATYGIGAGMSFIMTSNAKQYTIDGNLSLLVSEPGMVKGE